MTLDQILETCRHDTIAEHVNGHWFEKLTAAYLQTDWMYADVFAQIQATQRGFGIEGSAPIHSSLRPSGQSGSISRTTKPSSIGSNAR